MVRPYKDRNIKAHSGTKKYNHEYYIKVTKQQRINRRRHRK